MIATVTEIQQAKAEAFMERMVGVLNSAGLALMSSIGHRTGLFDVMARLEPSTSLEIAEASGLEERYVREWLGAMTTGRIVEYDTERETYYLPPEHAMALTRAAGANNVANTMQFISVLGGVEDRIIECFRNGGGVPYSAYGRFHEVMAEESTQTVGAALIDTILPMVHGLTESLTRGIKVLDIGCGSGRTLNLLAETFPHSSFMGYDFSDEGIAKARLEAEEKGLKNVCFVVKDVAMIDEVEKYDLVTAFDAIHDQAQPQRVLGVISQALKLDGTFLMQDIAGSCDVHKNMNHPVGPFLYTISCMHCMTVSLALGGAGLGTMWGVETAEKMLAEAGFKSVRVEQPPHDVMNYFYVARKS